MQGMMMGWGCAFGNYMDEQGDDVLPPERMHEACTKEQNPYGYSPILLFQNKAVKASGTIYSDRLLQWDSEKHDDLCIKHFGNKRQYWSDRLPQFVEAFLRDWCDYPELKLARIVEYCNTANGHPFWRFDYFKPEATTLGA